MCPTSDSAKTHSGPRRKSAAWEIATCLVLVPFIPVVVLWIDLPLACLVFDARSGQLTDHFLNTASPLLVHAIPDLGLIALLLLLVRRAREQRWRFFFMSSAVGLASYATTEFILKPIFGRTSPHDWVWHQRAEFHFFSASNYSFPSGHAALATGALATLWLLQKPTGKLPLAMIAAFDLAMVALNIHFLGDVLAGTLFGYVIARLATAV